MMHRAESKKLFTLLLITNSFTIRTFFENFVDRLKNHTLICANSQTEAQKFLNSTFVSYIIIDENTPYIELVSCCENIRTIRDYIHTPILIITGHLKKTWIRKLLKAGATDFLREPLDNDECALRMEIAKGTMKTQQKIVALSTHIPKFLTDSETTLNRRILMDDRAVKIVNQALSKNTTLALLLIEIDQYKTIRRTRGKGVAQALLCNFEDRMRKMLRKQDLLFNQKWGKFAAFLPKISKTGSTSISENIQEYLETETFSIGGLSIHLTVSIGVATLENSGDRKKDAAINLERLLTATTLCLNKAKKRGNTTVSYS